MKNNTVRTIKTARLVSLTVVGLALAGALVYRNVIQVPARDSIHQNEVCAQIDELVSKQQSGSQEVNIKKQPAKAGKKSGEKIELTSTIVDEMIRNENWSGPCSSGYCTLEDRFSVACDYYRGVIEKHEAHFWDELTKLYPEANRETYDAWLKENLDPVEVRKGKPENLSSKVVKMIDEILVDCGLNPQEVILKGEVKEEAYTPAYAFGKEIVVNEKVFLGYPKAAQRFVIAHEAMHVKNDDCIGGGVMREMMKITKATPEQQKAVCVSYKRLQESRADLQAMMLGKKYADGAVSFASEIVKRGESNAGGHPTCMSRLKAAKHMAAISGKLEGAVA